MTTTWDAARARVEVAIARMREGRMVIMSDDHDRENEGDLCVAAEMVTPEAINFMARHGRGLICLSLPAERCAELELDPMVPPAENTSGFGTAFTVSIEAAHGVTTGISAADRAHTIRTAMRTGARPRDLARPGHVFPLRARPGGVLERRGQTEGSVDLSRLAGLQPGCVICEVMSEDGTMARGPELEELSRRHDIPVVSVADLVAYRLGSETVIQRDGSAPLELPEGNFECIAYAPWFDGGEHLALVRGAWRADEPVLVRVHSKCLTGDTFGSTRCDCGDQLHGALDRIGRAGRGVVVYLDQEGRGIGLAAKLRAYRLQDGGLDTAEANRALGFPADCRDYGVAAQILRDLGVGRIRLMTNNPEKVAGLEQHGIEVVERIPLEVAPTEKNRAYLACKRDRMGHMLELAPSDRKVKVRPHPRRACASPAS